MRPWRTYFPLISRSNIVLPAVSFWLQNQGCHPEYKILLGQWSQVSCSYEPPWSAWRCPHAWQVLFGASCCRTQISAGQVSASSGAGGCCDRRCCQAYCYWFLTLRLLKSLHQMLSPGMFCSWRIAWAPKWRKLVLPQLLGLSSCWRTFAFMWKKKGREKMLLETR